jgi:hypothetical protein
VKGIAVVLDGVLQSLVDRELIRDCLTRYVRGVDRADKALAISAYWEDAMDDHGVVNGTANKVIDWLVAGSKTYGASMHMMGNIAIRIEGAKAFSEAYFIALTTLPGSMSGRSDTSEKDAYWDFMTAGRYLDILEKRHDEWRIIKRRMVYDWHRKFSDSQIGDRSFFGSDAEFGVPSQSDPSYDIMNSGRIASPMF